MSDEKKPGLSPEAIRRMRYGILNDAGYGKPPKATQFQKGQSGNPAGRPKRVSLSDAADHAGESLIEQMFMKQLERIIAVREGDTVHEVPVIEAIMKAQIKTAANGSPTAQKAILDQANRISRERAKQDRDNFVFWKKIKAQQQALLDKVRAAGTSERDVLPHPDDIVLGPGLSVTIKGPLDQEALEQQDQALRLRDLMLLYGAYSERFGDYDEAMTTAEGMSSATFLGLWFNRLMPERLQLSQIEQVMLALRADHTPRRALEREIKEAFAKMGVPASRLKPSGTFLDSLETIVARTGSDWAREVLKAVQTR